jgi:Ca2+-transporting ATPase
LITLAKKAGIDIEALEKNHKELREHPFDSARKRMTSIRFYNGKLMGFMKGAPEEVLKVCTHIFDGTTVRKLTVHDMQAMRARNDLWASGAMRNLAYAYREFSKTTDVDQLDLATAEQKMVFMGMVSMIDPPRDEVPEAMRVAREAHVPITIITGDNALTARAIAVRAGLADDPNDIVLIEGASLSSMSDHDVIALVGKGSAIFSRVAPEDKLRIVELTKRAGYVVAVTGDGINDAPALKRADIGVAMGKTGTDVAKQSSEIILLDDSFHTLVGAIQTGRVIYQNIHKAALSVLTGNGGELFVALLSLAAGAMFGIPTAIITVQILAIDLIAELFPVAALGWDPAESDLMHDKPRNLHDHILNKRSIIDLIFSGAFIGLLSYANYLLFFARNDTAISQISTSLPIYHAATTLTYASLCFCIFGSILLRRIKPGHKLFTKYLWSNSKLFIAFGISLMLMLSLVYIPFLQPYFGTAGLSVVDWLCAITVAVIYVIVRQFVQRRSAVAS